MQWANNLFGYGLLDPELEKRLSEQQRLRMGRSALMDASAALLANSGWQSQPTTLGQGLGQALQAGRQSYGQQAQGALQQQAAEAQKQQYEAWLSTLPPEQANMLRLLSPADAAKEAAKDRRETMKAPKHSAVWQQATDMGLEPGSPEHTEMVKRLATQSKAPVVNVSTGGYSPFDKALATKDAETYAGYRDTAQSAGSALESIGALRQINTLNQGGKVGEAMAFAGQYFGTDAAANMQTFKAVQNQMVLKAAESLKGAMSDRDIQLLQETLPQFGNDPRANEVVLQVLERAAKKQIQNFESADAHVQKSGSLRGFKPTIFSSQPMPETNAANVDLDALSEAEIAAEIERRRRGMR